MPRTSIGNTFSCQEFVTLASGCLGSELFADFLPCCDHHHVSQRFDVCDRGVDCCAFPSFPLFMLLISPFLVGRSMLIDTDRFNCHQVWLPLYLCSYKAKKTHAEETSERPGEARAPGPLPSAKSSSRVQLKTPSYKFRSSRPVSRHRCTRVTEAPGHLGHFVLPRSHRWFPTPFCLPSSSHRFHNHQVRTFVLDPGMFVSISATTSMILLQRSFGHTI